MRLLRLGLRLSFGGGSTGRLRLFLMALGSATAAFVLLTALSLSGLADRQSERAQAISPLLVDRVVSKASLRGTVISDGWDGRPLQRVIVAETRASAPVPPGLERLPAAGEVALSPDLARLIDTEPLLAKRFPQATTATITADGLIEPRQLLAYVGVSNPTEIWSPSDIDGWGDPTATARLGPRAARTIGLLVLLTLVAPVLMFMLTCSRLSATARLQRLAGLRLLGLSPWRTQVVAAVESGIVATIGAVAGLGSWLAWRHIDPTVQVGSFGWYSSDLWTDPGSIALGIGFLVCLSIATGAAGSRAAIASPMGTRRERSIRKVSRFRLLPLAVGAGLLAWSWQTSGRRGHFISWMAPFAAGMVATAVGIVLMVPFVAILIGRLLGRSPRPAAILAGARLRHDPAVAGRVVAAMAITLFAAGFAQVVLINVDASYAQQPHDATGSVVNLTAYGTNADAERYGAISDLNLALPKWQMGGVGGIDAVAASCAQLRQATTGDLSACRDNHILRVRTTTIGQYEDEASNTAATVNQTLTGAGFPTASGTIDLVFPAGNLNFSAAVIVPPSLAPTTTSFVVPFPGRNYDPQQTVGGLAATDPGATWDSSVTSIDRLDSARIYAAIVAVGTVSALVIALASLAVATLDRTIELAAPQARLAALGTPTRTLRYALVLQILPVCTLMLVTAASIAVLGGASYLRWGNRTAGIPLAPIGTLVAIGLASSALATLGAVAGSAATPRADVLRTE